MFCRKFARLDVHRNVGGLVIPCRLSHIFFLKCCVSQGHVALTGTEGQTGSSEDMPFYVSGSWGWREMQAWREVRGGFAGRWGATLRQAKLNLHPTLYACLCSPAMHSAGGRQNLSPSSGNYSELVRHVWYPGMHLSLIWCIYIQDLKGEERKNRGMHLIFSKWSTIEKI